MTDQLFPSSQQDIFAASGEPSISTAGYDVPSMVQQLVNEGFSHEESAGAVARYISNRAQETAAQHSVNGSAMKLRTDAERADYMKRLRSQVSPSVWIPPQMQEEYASEQRVAEAQEQFKQNMKARASQGGMMRSTQAAVDFFKSYPKK
ncbi:hypothetical protein ACQV2C_07795 [Pantoea allii]|uniref:hypothetical protein n=1 Tax=Pantoea allii TaxID=574096 RepID=UPI003D322FEF